MKKTLLIFIVTCIVSITQLSAQSSSTANSSEYTTALGIKFYPTAITLKHFLTGNKNALEVLGYFYNRGTRITGLYEIHGNINGVNGLKWYIGPGLHVGLYNSKAFLGSYTSIGVDGVLGLDYKITNAPINLSIDWQPSFEFGEGYYKGFAGDWGGIAVRYTF
jgi:hypothetical protein